MEPQAKRRRRINSTNLQPFPVDLENNSITGAFEFTGYYTGIGVEIFEPTAIAKIHQNGCFGSRTSDSESLVLFPEEALFLHHSLRCLRIFDLNDKVLDTIELCQIFLRLKPRFVELYVAYVYLRSKNWVVKCGLKFGGDFLLYKEGPKFYHGSYVVLVRSNLFKSIDLQGNHRIAEASKKELLLIEVSHPSEFPIPNCNFINHLHHFTASEIIPKRFNIHQER